MQSDSIKSGNGAAGDVLANASKCATQLPGLAAARNTIGLAAESQGGPGKLQEAVQAYETALALLDRQNQQQPPAQSKGDAGFELTYLGAGPSTGESLAEHLTQGGGSNAAVQALAIRLNLARALSKLGSALMGLPISKDPAQGAEGAKTVHSASVDACRRAVAIYKDLEVQGLMQSDASAWLAYASERG